MKLSQILNILCQVKQVYLFITSRFELLTVQLELTDSNSLIQDESETENARSELKHIRNRKNFHDILRKLELNIEFEVKITDSSIVQLHIPPIGIRYQK